MIYFTNFHKRTASCNKYDNGNVLFISGSEGMAGAAILNIIGARSAGTGYIQSLLPENIYPIVAKNEITTVYHVDYLNNPSFIETINLNKIDAIGIGSGLNNHPYGKNYLIYILNNFHKPIICDAYALQLLSEDESLYDLNNNLILTPHMGEFSRLTKLSIEEITSDKETIARDFSLKHHLTLVLKGPETIITNDKGMYHINESGNEVLSRAGSGDVLTGMICGLIPRYDDTFEAVRDGVYLHGHVADMYVKDHSKEVFDLKTYPHYADMFFSSF